MTFDFVISVNALLMRRPKSAKTMFRSGVEEGVALGTWPMKLTDLLMFFIILILVHRGPRIERYLIVLYMHKNS